MAFQKYHYGENCVTQWAKNDQIEDIANNSITHAKHMKKEWEDTCSMDIFPANGDLQLQKANTVEAIQILF